MSESPPDHVPMHSGVRAIYYTYKMLLSTLRVALSPVSVRHRKDAYPAGNDEGGKET
jgi:hypothetical protein